MLLDGPYGGLKDQTLARFDKAVIIVGGAGAGFTLPVIEDVLRKQFQSKERFMGGRAEEIRTTEIKVMLAVRNGRYLNGDTSYSVRKGGGKIQSGVQIT